MDEELLDSDLTALQTHGINACFSNLASLLEEGTKQYADCVKEIETKVYSICESSHFAQSSNFHDVFVNLLEERERDWITKQVASSYERPPQEDIEAIVERAEAVCKEKLLDFITRHSTPGGISSEELSLLVCGVFLARQMSDNHTSPSRCQNHVAENTLTPYYQHYRNPINNLWSEIRETLPALLDNDILTVTIQSLKPREVEWNGTWKNLEARENQRSNPRRIMAQELDHFRDEIGRLRQSLSERFPLVSSYTTAYLLLQTIHGQRVKHTTASVVGWKRQAERNQADIERRWSEYNDSLKSGSQQLGIIGSKITTELHTASKRLAGYQTTNKKQRNDIKTLVQRVEQMGLSEPTSTWEKDKDLSEFSETVGANVGLSLHSWNENANVAEVLEDWGDVWRVLNEINLIDTNPLPVDSLLDGISSELDQLQSDLACIQSLAMEHGDNSLSLEHGDSSAGFMIPDADPVLQRKMGYAGRFGWFSYSSARPLGYVPFSLEQFPSICVGDLFCHTIEGSDLQQVWIFRGSDDTWESCAWGQLVDGFRLVIRTTGVPSMVSEATWDRRYATMKSVIITSESL